MSSRAPLQNLHPLELNKVSSTSKAQTPNINETSKSKPSYTPKHRSDRNMDHHPHRNAPEPTKVQSQPAEAYDDVNTKHKSVTHANVADNAATNTAPGGGSGAPVTSESRKTHNNNPTVTPKPKREHKKEKEKLSALCKTPPSTIKNVRGNKHFKRGSCIGAVSIYCVFVFICFE